MRSESITCDQCGGDIIGTIVPVQIKTDWLKVSIDTVDKSFFDRLGRIWPHAEDRSAALEFCSKDCAREYVEAALDKHFPQVRAS